VETCKNKDLVQLHLNPALLLQCKLHHIFSAATFVILLQASAALLPDGRQLCGHRWFWEAGQKRIFNRKLTFTSITKLLLL
jgi:hypothetical protein